MGGLNARFNLFPPLGGGLNVLPVNPGLKFAGLKGVMQYCNISTKALSQRE